VKTLGRVFRLTGRVALLGVTLGVLAVVAIQFEGIVVKNVAVAAELRASSDRIAALSAREVRQRRTIARLASPLGAIPEIHDELRLVGSNEEIIYVRGMADRSSMPRDWDDSQ
jgi:hypothetical protein